MIDSHAHLGLADAPEAELVAAARRVGVERILTVGIDEESNRAAVRTAQELEGVFASVGRHPNSAEGFDEVEIPASDPRPGILLGRAPGTPAPFFERL